ncbi:hypothetical protein E6R60_33345 [Streptomyces sp. A0642]|uniref:hypothetical protein n=1 Tax=Streptomyces sp. A0642 TaxID=2563100 RepID=UPI0010A2579D|nr:hypothetical protein [Streptomyces sp. A0642]THA65400.1 hypothetical protein E6R60_33345 [Streptomyces sp. A0642]
MDFIALNLSDLTTPDRADRARKAWELYGTEHGDGVENPIEDLIADLLHLADTDEHPGGAAGVLTRAVGSYAAEIPSWPTTEVEVDAEAAGHYVAQARGAGGDWFAVGCGDDPRTVAELLWTAMQLAGFRFSELHAHTEDLIAGHILTSDDGCEFRVIEHDES